MVPRLDLQAVQIIAQTQHGTSSMTQDSFIHIAPSGLYHADICSAAGRLLHDSFTEGNNCLHSPISNNKQQKQPLSNTESTTREHLPAVSIATLCTARAVGEKGKVTKRFKPWLNRASQPAQKGSK